MLEAAQNEVSRVFPVVEDLERANLELRSAYFAKDEELNFMHAKVPRLKKIASKLESKEVDLQGTLSTGENLRKELDELQSAHNGLVKENMQLKNEKVGHEVAFSSSKGQEVQAGAVEDELMEALATRSSAAVECVIIEERAVTQATKE
ncbi:hypothetical protein ACFX2J_040373 [Malus domestica]